MNWLVNAARHELIQTPILILAAVGILAFSPWRRRPGWWLMAAGLVLMLLGYVSQELLLQAEADSMLATVMTRMAQLREIWLLLFMTGFAGLGLAIARERLSGEETPEVKRLKGRKKP